MNLAFDDIFDTMPWDQIDNVVFDVGNVLLHYDPKSFAAQLFPGDEALQKAVLLKTPSSPYWGAIDHGTMPHEEIIAAMIGRDTHLADAIRRYMDGWSELMDVEPEGFEVLKKCRAMGKKLYVLSNYGTVGFAYNEEHRDFFKWFDGMGISARLQLIKPDARIYRWLTDTYQLEPARTLFIDDNLSNIEAALLEGWQGICYNDPGKLYRFFEI